MKADDYDASSRPQRFSLRSLVPARRREVSKPWGRPLTGAIGRW